nr:hypothetical protein [Tanacetum cinerariifolium]
MTLFNGICDNCIYGAGMPIICTECGGIVRGGLCLPCDLREKYLYNYDPNAYSFNNSNYFPQPQDENYLCNLCGNNSHDGYDCQQQFPFVYEQEPSYNHNCDDNYYPHESPSYPCCDYCEGSHETFQCQPDNQNVDFSGSDQIQTPQYPDVNSPSPEIKVPEKQKQKMEDTMFDLVEICHHKQFLCIHGDIDNLTESALDSKLLSINSINSQQSNAENLLPILSKCEVTLKDEIESEEFKIYSNPLCDEDKINYDKLDLHCFNVESDFVVSLLNQELNAEIADTIIESIPLLPIPVPDGNSQHEEIDIVTETDDVLPPSVENDDDDYDLLLGEADLFLSDNSIPPEIPSGEIKVHLEVLSVLWGNRLPIRTVRCHCLVPTMTCHPPTRPAATCTVPRIQLLAASRHHVAASYWTTASDVAATSAPVNAVGQQRSTPPVNNGQRRQPPVNGGGSRWSTVAVNDGSRWRTTVDCRWTTVDHHRTTGQRWICKSNFRLRSDLKSKESTIQVVYDVLKLTSFYKAFLVTADVPEIYMQEFWATATIHHHLIRFKMNNKKHIVNLEYFREMLQICQRIHNQQFDELPFKEEILTFLRELGHSGEINMISNVEHKDAKMSNEMYYPLFTKVIINFFMTKDQSILRRNKVNWHFSRDDHMFSMIKLVSKHQNTQQYAAILPIELTNEAIRNFESYKEYYAIASGAEPPKTKASKSSEEDDDDDEKTNSDNDDDDFIHIKFSTHDDDDEDKKEESFDPIVQTPSHDEKFDDEDNDKDSHGMNVKGYEMDDE